MNRTATSARLAEPLLDESLESPDAWSREIERYLERVRMAEPVDPQFGHLLPRS